MQAQLWMEAVLVAVVKAEEEFDGAEEALAALEPLEVQLGGHFLEPSPWVLDLVEVLVVWWALLEPDQVSKEDLGVDLQPLKECNPWVLDQEEVQVVLLALGKQHHPPYF